MGISNALLECSGEMNPTQIPCYIITTFGYPNVCENYGITFINSTPDIVGQWNLTSYGSSGRCNTTFNFSAYDTYIFNITSGESGRIIVERKGGINEMQIALALFAVGFIIVGIIIYVLGRKHENNAETEV